MGLGVRTYGGTYVRTDSRVKTKIFEIDGLPNFLRYGTPLRRLRRAGAPLLHLWVSITFVVSITYMLNVYYIYGWYYIYDFYYIYG